jgi:type IV pilus assembly protein PilV
MTNPTAMKPSTSTAFGCGASSQRGASLIEVLVAVLILALGLLGMAGLQASALKGNQSSYGRAQAVMLSYYMLDTMRADRDGAVASRYNMAATCSPAAITTTDLAGNTRQDWLQSLRDALGNEDTTCGVINCDLNGNCLVQVIWDDSRAGGLGNQRVETRSRL